jgi:hypothetical protein
MEKNYISKDNGQTWLNQSFNVFSCEDGELYNGGADGLTVFKVVKVDNKISSQPCTDFINPLPQE